MPQLTSGMKNAICNGGCKKGDCNRDCKTSAKRKKPVVKAVQIRQEPKHELRGFYLQFDLLGETIKNVRKERHLSKKELGRLAGIKESQISKIENRLQVARFDSMIKVFKALHLKINFNVELPDQTVTLIS